MKFIRIVFFYFLFFVLAFIIAGIFIQPIGDGYFVLASFVAPAILVWRMERRRSGTAAASLVEPSITADAARRRSVATPTTTNAPNINRQSNNLPAAPLSASPNNATKWQQLDLAAVTKKNRESSALANFFAQTDTELSTRTVGIVVTEEIAGIEKIYRALGLDPNLVYSDLHAGEVPDTPMRVRLAQPGAPGEAIPLELPTSAKRLDAARIASIRQDTDRVSAVLANIFTTDTANEEDENTAAPSALAGLDAKHTALIRELITRKHWTEETFLELTARHGLMVAGALETVNEWAFGVHDEALLEEYEGYDVSPDIADALADTFEKERRDVEAETPGTGRDCSSPTCWRRAEAMALEEQSEGLRSEAEMVEELAADIIREGRRNFWQ